MSTVVLSKTSHHAHMRTAASSVCQQYSHSHHLHPARRADHPLRHHHHQAAHVSIPPSHIPLSKRQRLFALAYPAFRLGRDLGARLSCRRLYFSTHTTTDAKPLKSPSSSNNVQIFDFSSNSSPSSHQPTHANKSTQTSPRSKKRTAIRKWVQKSALYGAAASMLAVVFTLILDRNAEDISNWQLAVMKTLPLRLLSRLWGLVHSIDLPVWMREPIYMAWTRAFGCELSECEHPLSHHTNLASFFTRTLKPGLRPIDPHADIVSPCDAEITVFGEVTPEGRLDQIKGMSYDLKEFLGFAPPLSGPLLNSESTGSGSKLYYTVLYLAPGDYHRFHSSADWCINQRYHFAGQLFPVKPRLASFVPSLFTRNERIVLSGHWKHGFYSYSPVGAYNVGSMRINFDSELRTNRGAAKLARGRAGTADFRDFSDSPVHAHKGDEIGRFELGSTVVLVWEVKDGDFIFTFDEANRKIKMGMPLGVVRPRGSGVDPNVTPAQAHQTNLAISETKGSS